MRLEEVGCMADRYDCVWWMEAWGKGGVDTEGAGRRGETSSMG